MGASWQNYFVASTRAFASDGHIPAEKLRETIEKSSGAEAYHCAYDLEPRPTFENYSGLMRGALGYVWFDFDSKDGGVAAQLDARRFVEWIGAVPYVAYFSGSKGFHVGLPESLFGSEPRATLGAELHLLATALKATYPTLDTTIYNANRKFRALGSRHPKTGLFKIACSLALPLETIRGDARARGSLSTPLPPILPADARLTALMRPPVAPPKGEKKTYRAPAGQAAFTQCGFLAHARDNAATLDEPSWYAALSVVSRFQNGRQQCHALSHKHPGYTVPSCNKKIDQAETESAPRTCESISKLWDGCVRCPLYGKITSPVNIFDRRFWELSDKGQLLPQYGELLEEFQKQRPYKTIADMKTVYVFESTHYAEYTPIEIKAFAETEFQPKPFEKHRAEFYSKVLANTVTRRSFFHETTKNKLNFQNCVFDLETNERHTHSPEFGFRGVLPFDYDPAAVCPTFDWWIGDVMLGDKELVAILQEFMGYVVRGGPYTHHKALWLSGTGRNGKSTFLSVLKALIGSGNYSTLSIRQITNDKFASADLDGKIANFSEETSPEELSDSGPFKNLTGDGELLAQKKYGDPYTFRNRAKLIMTYNEIPELRDLSPGMLSRPIIVPWEKDLSAEKTQDKTLGDKLLAELPGIFNFALLGWKQLEANQRFTHSAKSALAKEAIREASCSATQWAKAYLTLLPIDANSKKNVVVAPHELYEAYKEHEGRYAYKPAKFFRRLQACEDVKDRVRRRAHGVEYFALMIKPRAPRLKLVYDSKPDPTPNSNPTPKDSKIDEF